MISKIISAANIGYEGQLIQIECDSSNGLPGLTIVGLGNKAIDESKERIRSAIKNSSLEFPRKRITLNLAPADLPKDGAGYDLPMALAILVISNQLDPEALKDTLFIGELALDGSVRPVRGIIGYIEVAKRKGIRQVVIPADNVMQACLVDGITIFAAKDLRSLYMHLKQELSLPIVTRQSIHKRPRATQLITFNDIYGQEQAKRALIVAAAGRHNVLLKGPPGSGKTMLAKSLVSILPLPSTEEIIAITKLHSLAGELREGIMSHRPFRSPHHTSSHVALTGGGKTPRPGEISLAHLGVLFLDELPEYPRSSLEALRQPLEDRVIRISRANHRVTYPADFMLVGTQNPCPCGYFGDTTKECSCSMQQIVNYGRKISGPLLDRLDLILNVPRVEQQKILDNPSTKSSISEIKEQIDKARELQIARFGTPLVTNAHLSAKEIRDKAFLDKAAKAQLDVAAEKLSLSARAYIKVLRVARTIADLEQSKVINMPHVSEALQYRQR